MIHVPHKALVVLVTDILDALHSPGVLTGLRSRLGKSGGLTDNLDPRTVAVDCGHFAVYPVNTQI
jgi:hypothetical protein